MSINFTLSKEDKKIARMLIDKSLDREYKIGIENADKIITKWKSGKITNQEAYIQLYKKIEMHDKHLSNRYDNLTGANYLITIVNLVIHKIIDPEEINSFSPQTQEVMNFLLASNA